MEKNDLNVIFSHKSDEWETPLWFFNKLNNIHQFTLDACATDLNFKCSKYYTKQNDRISYKLG